MCLGPGPALEKGCLSPKVPGHVPAGMSLPERRPLPDTQEGAVSLSIQESLSGLVLLLGGTLAVREGHPLSTELWSGVNACSIPLGEQNSLSIHSSQKYLD